MNSPESQIRELVQMIKVGLGNPIFSVYAVMSDSSGKVIVEYPLPGRAPVSAIASFRRFSPDKPMDPYLAASIVMDISEHFSNLTSLPDYLEDIRNGAMEALAALNQTSAT